MAMRPSFDALTQFAQANLDKRRFLHTLGVAHVALVLAELNGVNREKAATAALLHDCAKQMNREALHHLLASNGDRVEALEFDFPSVLHAPAGAMIARSKFGITDVEVLETIAHHPTGKGNSSPLLMVLMAADYTEPGRCHDGVEAIRVLVRKNLREGLRLILTKKIEHVQSRGNKIHPRAADMLADL